MTSVGSAYDFYVATRHLRAGASELPNANSTFSDLMQENAQAEDVENDDRPSLMMNFQGRLYDLGKFTPQKMPESARINIAELPEDKYQSFMENQKQHLDMREKGLELRHSSGPELPENDPRTKIYATIVIAGKGIITIDNQGCIGGHDAAMARLEGLLPDEVNGTNGPALAKARAEAAAAILGGRIVMSSTAISQTQFNALPSLDTLERLIDYDAMKNDPDYQQLEKMRENHEQIKLDRAAYLAKQQTAETAA